MRYLLYHRLIFLFLFIQAEFCGKSLLGNDKLYGVTIFAESIDDPLYNASLKDLAFFLKQATGQEFVIKPSNPKRNLPGIYILLNKPGIKENKFESKLDAGSIESFYISSTENSLLLVSTHPMGLSRAIYFYLDKLGFRWYFPGNDWTYLPPLSDVRIKIDALISPSFALRNFFGTGGIFPVRTLDPDNLLQKSWDDWKRRNRMGGAVTLGGHYGETFNLKYKQVLELHPEYLALIKGKRTAWNESAKWCISNPEFRKLFVKSRVDDARIILQQSKYNNEIIAISVDPSDGGGHCECENCHKLGSVSNRVFLLASEVAKELKTISPRLYANLYAYNEHAAPPSFSLPDNLIVQVIPYAFQNVGTPEEMIAQWRKKSNYLFLYDYYGIPDWHHELPLTDKWNPGNLIRKISYWNAQNIKGFLLESSYSIGGAGMGLYLSSRTGWDMMTDIEKEKNLFLKQMFGNASSIMKKFFEKISTGFGGGADLPDLIAILQQAALQCGSESCEKRILLWQAYMHYCILYYEWYSADKAARPASLDKLMQFCWQLYFTGMIHSTRMAELLPRTPDAVRAVTDKWDPYAPNTTGLKTLRQFTTEDWRQLAETDLKSNPKPEGFIYDKRLKNYKVLDYTPNNNLLPKDGVMLLDFPQTFVKASPNSLIEFWVKVNETSQNDVFQNITAYITDSATGAVVQSKKISIDKNWLKVVFKLPRDKIFGLNIVVQNWIRLAVTSDQWIAFKTLPIYAVMGKPWFYIPPNTKYIYYTNNSTDQPQFIDPGGQSLVAQKINDKNMYRLTIPDKTSGKWWQVSGTEYKKVEFYNNPDLFFLHPSFKVNQ